MSLGQNLKPQYPFSAKKLDSLRALQEVLVRLYFSDRLQQEVARDAELVLKTFNLDPSYKNYLPAPLEPDFQAECWGRRIMVAREISLRFTRFFTLVLGTSKNPVAIADCPLFRSFVESDEFLRSESSFEHPYGIGRGYENVSKFFLWLIGPGRDMVPIDPAVWNAVYTDFSLHLLTMSKHSNEPFYRKMGTAVIFPDHADPQVMIIITSDRILRSRLNPQTADKIFDLSKDISIALRSRRIFSVESQKLKRPALIRSLFRWKIETSEF